MTTEIKDITARALATRINTAASSQVLVNQAFAAAFTGKTVKANKDSLIHQTLQVLMGDRDKHNAKINKQIAAKKLRTTKTDTEKRSPAADYKRANQFPGLAMFQTMLARALKLSTNKAHTAKRISVKATGKTPNIALVTVTESATKAIADAKKPSVTKAKQLENLMNDSSISLNEALESLIAQSSLSIVQDALAKIAAKTA